MSCPLYVSAVKGSKFSRDTVPSDDVIEIVSSDDGSESSEEEEEEEGEGEELGAGLEEGEEGEASSDMQLSDQEQGQSESARSNGGTKFCRVFGENFSYRPMQTV